MKIIENPPTVALLCIEFCLFDDIRAWSPFFHLFRWTLFNEYKKSIRFLVFHIETRTNKEWTLLKIPTLYAHSKAVILSGKSHKITMKTFPIFIRESNNHMNDLRLFFHLHYILFESAPTHRHFRMCTVAGERFAESSTSRDKHTYSALRMNSVECMFHACTYWKQICNLMCSYYAVINILRWHLFVID